MPPIERSGWKFIWSEMDLLNVFMLFPLKPLNKGQSQERLPRGTKQSLSSAARSPCFHLPVRVRTVTARLLEIIPGSPAHAALDAARPGPAGWASETSGAGMWFSWTSTQFRGPQAPRAGLCPLLSCFGPGHWGQTSTEPEESLLPAGCGLLGLVGTESGKVSPAPSGTTGAESWSRPNLVYMARPEGPIIAPLMQIGGRMVGLFGVFA